MKKIIFILMTAMFVSILLVGCKEKNVSDVEEMDTGVSTTENSEMDSMDDVKEEENIKLLPEEEMHQSNDATIEPEAMPDIYIESPNEEFAVGENDTAIVEFEFDE